MKKQNNYYQECEDCIYKYNLNPKSPCNSCSQHQPTNFTEVEAEND